MKKRNTFCQPTYITYDNIVLVDVTTKRLKLPVVVWVSEGSYGETARGRESKVPEEDEE